MFMSNNFKRTTVLLPVHIYEETKIIAVLTKTNMSRLMSIALREKIDRIKNTDSKDS